MGLFHRKSPETARTPEQVVAEEWDDPLAVQVGAFARSDAIPSDGWPDTIINDGEIIRRILSYMPKDD